MATSLGPRWLSLKAEDRPALYSDPKQLFHGAVAGGFCASPNHTFNEGVSFNTNDAHAMQSQQTSNVQVAHPARLVGISNSFMAVFPSLCTPAEPSVFNGIVLPGKPYSSTAVGPCSPQRHSPIIDTPRNAHVITTRGYPVPSPFDSASVPTERALPRRASVTDLGSDQSSLDDACVPGSLAPRGIPRNLSLDTTCSMGHLANMMPHGVILRATPVPEPRVPGCMPTVMVPAQAIGTDATVVPTANTGAAAMAATAAAAEANRAADVAAAICRVESLNATTPVEDIIDVDFLLASFEDPSAGSLPDFEECEGRVKTNPHGGIADLDLDGVDLKALFDSFANDNGDGDGDAVDAELCSPLSDGRKTPTEAIFSGVPIPSSSPFKDGVGEERSSKRAKRSRRLSALQPTTPEQQVFGGLTRALYDPESMHMKKRCLARGDRVLHAMLPALGSVSGPCASTQCSYLFTKCLTQSDITRFGRIILPRAAVEANFPYCADREGVPLELFTSEGQCFPCSLKYWLNGPRPNPKRMYLLESCSALIAAFGLMAGDQLEFYRAPDGRIVLDARVSA